LTAWLHPKPDPFLPPGLLSGLLFFAVVIIGSGLHHFFEGQRLWRLRGLRRSRF